MTIELKTSAEIETMAGAGRLIALAFAEIEERLFAGQRTKDIDSIAATLIESAGGELLFKNYRGFPGNTCISVNDEVVHGIPGERQLVDGDIFTVDIGVRYQGFCADAARTFSIGRPAEEVDRLVKVAQQALDDGIQQAVVGQRVSKICAAIDNCVSASGFFGVDEYVGHGIGRSLHEEPQVPNCLSTVVRQDPILCTGMVLAIEPIVCQSNSKTHVLGDGWTVSTVDGGLAAHVENTVAICEEGPRILTQL